MDFIQDWGLTAMVFAPLVGVALMMLFPKDAEDTHKVIALGASLVTAALGIAVFSEFDFDNSGTLQMVRHIRKGGFFAILADQYVQWAEKIPFLGHITSTTTFPAELALKYNLPLVPAFGLRDSDGRTIQITFEEPIAHTDATTMMTEFNERIAARIHANPGQWYWLHRRWKNL